MKFAPKVEVNLSSAGIFLWYLLKNKENMLLSGEEIKKYLKLGEGKSPEEGIIVEPLLERDIQVKPSSLDLRLGPDAIIFHTIKKSSISLFSDLKSEEEKDSKELFKEIKIKAQRDMLDYIKYEELDLGEELVLHPGQFVMGSTLEYISMPRKLAGRLEGRSSIGRLGIQIHITAGFVDPGFKGNLTYELINLGEVPVSLYCGMRIAQLSFYEIKGEIKKDYSEDKSSKYSFDTTTSASRIYEDEDLETLLKIRKKKLIN